MNVVVSIDYLLLFVLITAKYIKENQFLLLTKFLSQLEAKDCRLEC